MRVAQIIPSLGKKSGGPSRSVYALTKGLRTVGCETEILTNNYLVNPNIVSEGWIKAINVEKVRPFEYNPTFKKMVVESDYDLYHIHSIYSYPTTIAARVARKKGKPYIIAPRGSLYQKALRGSSAWKKAMFNRLFLMSDLNHASAVQVTCKEELQQVRSVGVKSPIAIIPNSLTLPDVTPTVAKPDKFRVAFVGRISPIKNLDSLIKAWAQAGFANSRDAELIIIGEAALEKEQAYLASLKTIESSLGINNLKWAGSKYGAEKDGLLNSCSYLFLPSHSENFGMVVPEALIQGVPVVASKGTPWESLVENNCGYWIDNSVDSMAQTLSDLYKLSDVDRKVMGINGQRMVIENFSMEAISNRLLSLYSWVLGDGKIPEFVSFE